MEIKIEKKQCRLCERITGHICSYNSEMCLFCKVRTKVSTANADKSNSQARVEKDGHSLKDSILPDIETKQEVSHE